MMKSYRWKTLAALAVAALVACGTPEPEQTYVVTPEAGSGGSIEPDTPQTVDEGETVSFVLIADDGHELQGVEGTCDGTLEADLFTTNPVEEDCTVQALFAASQHRVTVSHGPGGSVEPAGEQIVEHEQVLEFQIHPEVGFEIREVSGCGGSLDGGLYVTAPIVEDCEVMATFEESVALELPLEVERCHDDVTLRWDELEVDRYDLIFTGEDFDPGDPPVHAQVREDVTSPHLETGLQTDETYFFALVGVREGESVAYSEVLEAAPTVLDVDLIGADPEVFYGEAQTPIALFLSGPLDQTVTRVWAVEEATGEPSDLEFAYDPAAPRIIDATLPAGLEAGPYSVFVETSGEACPAYLPAGLSVATELTVALDHVEPTSGSTAEDTIVELRAIDPAPTGETQLQELPRVYLRPEEGPAVELHSLEFLEATRLRAMVPSGLTVGSYEVVVVNPDGGVGVVEAPFWVTDEETPSPLLGDVSPTRALIEDITLDLRGERFSESAEVRYECLDENSTEPFELTAPQTTWVDQEHLEAVFPVSSEGLGEGTSCVVLVDQPVTAAGGVVATRTAAFSAVTVVNPTGALTSSETAPSLNVPRRGLAALSGAATYGERFFYALGGDDGAGQDYDVIEIARPGRFRGIAEDGWRVQSRPIRLHDPDQGFYTWPLTEAGAAQVGRYLFLVGGRHNDESQATVLRAQILDPDDAPRTESARRIVAESSGLDEGLWIYRVAAVFPDDHLSNPRGESLPGPPTAVRAPDLGEDALHLHLSWQPVSNATAYRVYRSPTAHSPSGTEVLIAEVQTTEFLDTGDAEPDPDLQCEAGAGEGCPLALGDLGEWAVMAYLPHQVGEDPFYANREAPCVQTAQDPTDPQVTYLYTAFGLDGFATAKGSISVTTLTEISDQTQLVGQPWISASTAPQAPVPRWQCGAFRADPWLYFGPGRTTGDTLTNTAVASRAVGTLECEHQWESCVQACEDPACQESCDIALDTCEATFPGGELVCTDSLADTEEPCLVHMTWSGVNRTGYALASLGQNLAILGGMRFGGLTNSILMADVVDPPMLSLWSQGSVNLSEDRHLAGHLQEAGRIFVIGGEIEDVAQDVTGAVWVGR